MFYAMLAGYGCQVAEKAKPSLVSAVPESPLREALLALSITPLNKAKVARDKEKLLKSVLSTYRLRSFGSSLFLMVSTMAVAFTAYILLLVLMHGDEWTIAASVCAFACLSCGFAWRTRYLMRKYFPIFTPLSSRYIAWETCSLQNWVHHYRFVPEAAKQKAKAVKQALSAAEVLVEWMDADPYLVVRLGKECEYIHQWE